MTERLKNKVACITGAGSGIGWATARRFVEEGARVLAADIDEAASAELVQQLGADAVHFVRCDVSQPAQLKAAIDTAAARFGGLDILFNNAGAAGSPATVEEFDADAWDRTHALLLRSVAAGTAYAVPHLKRRGGGAIVCTSSISASGAGYAPIAYSVAKAGVVHYCRVAAAQLSAHRIRINAVLPGFIATRIFGHAMGMDREGAQRVADQVAQASGKANPIGRAGKPEDIAEAVVFLASDEAGFITGTHLTVDGGLTIGPRHSWDVEASNPLAETLGMTREQMIALRAGRRA